MPRGRGGARQGTPGTAYSNRTDLNMPISTVPNQEYGKAAAQQRAQQTVPMAQAPNVAPTAQPAAQPAQSTVAPGSLPYTGPTERPNEPITAGIDVGPGPGSEIMTGPPSGMLTGVFKNLSRDPHATSASYDAAATARAFGL